MSIKISKESYEKLIKEDLAFLDRHCPSTLELDHIKAIIRDSVDWYYPSKEVGYAIRRIENKLIAELKKQKKEGKPFLDDKEIDNLIGDILEEE